MSADILSRFSSLELIRNLLAEGLIAAVIDGLMASATLLMMLVYSVRLTLVVLGAFALYGLLRLALFAHSASASEAAIEKKARLDSTLIETLRAMRTAAFDRGDHGPLVGERVRFRLTQSAGPLAPAFAQPHGLVGKSYNWMRRRPALAPQNNIL
jgi:hypothetical protein